MRQQNLVLFLCLYIELVELVIEVSTTAPSLSATKSICSNVHSSEKYTRYTVVLFWKQKRTIGSYINKKVLLSRHSPCFFPAFLFFDGTFFLNSLEQCGTDSLFATIPL